MEDDLDDDDILDEVSDDDDDDDDEDDDVDDVVHRVSGDVAMGDAAVREEPNHQRRTRNNVDLDDEPPLAGYVRCVHFIALLYLKYSHVSTGCHIDITSCHSCTFTHI